MFNVKRKYIIEKSPNVKSMQIGLILQIPETTLASTEKVRALYRFLMPDGTKHTIYTEYKTVAELANPTLICGTVRKADFDFTKAESVDTIAAIVFSKTESITIKATKDFLFFSDEENPGPVTEADWEPGDDDPLYNGFIDNSKLGYESFEITESLCSADRVKFGLCEAAICQFTVYNMDIDFTGKTIWPYIQAEGTSEKIPLGKYKVHSVKKEHTNNIIKKTIVAYDYLQELDQNVAAWYTEFFNDRGDEDPNNRAIYESYFNLAKNINFENRSFYHETQIAEFEPNFYGQGRLSFGADAEEGERVWVTYNSHRLPITDASKRYVIDYDYITDGAGVMDRYPDWTKYYSKTGKRIIKNNIIIYATVKGSIDFEIFDIDSGDYFMLNPDTTELRIYYPYTVQGVKGASKYVINKMRVSTVDEPLDLENGWQILQLEDVYSRLVPIDAQTTARDMIRSLTELTGAFFKLDRTGRPQFIYAHTTGLYPEDDLFPDDELFPLEAATGSFTATTANYSRMSCEEYSVEPYGRIQIARTGEDEDQKVLLLDYRGGEGRNTYIIDDNVLLQSDKLYGANYKFEKIIERMYNRIKGVVYTPHETQAAGLPFLETGDRIVVLTKTGGTESFIFRRTMQGIHSLRDTYEAEGPRWTRPIGNNEE